MKIFATLVAKNEADVIDDLFDHLAEIEVFDRIYFYDLGSEDDTLARAARRRDLPMDVQRLDRDYTESLRHELLVRPPDLTPGDWLAIVDADEFYAEDPRPLLQLADHEGADCVDTYSAEFAFTERDLEMWDGEDVRLPVHRRRRHYLIDWSETRYFKYLPGRGGEPLSSEQRGSRRLLLRHYPYRSPTQMQTRIRTRLENRRRAEHLIGWQRWAHVYSEDWRDYMMPSRLFHEDDGGDLRFGLPPGVSVADYALANPKNPFGGELPQLALEFAAEREHARL